MLRTLFTIGLVCASLAVGVREPAAAGVSDARPLVLAQVDSGFTDAIAGAEAQAYPASYDVAQAACLSQAQIRQAVASGQARRLSEFYGQIQQATGSAQVLPGPQLCWSGNVLVYIVNVLSGNGVVRTVTINASNGSIVSY